MENTETRLRNLWERALAGSESAYREFLTASASLLRSYVQRQLTRLGRSQSEAEDIVQEALLAIHAKRHTHDPDIPIMAWAYAITRYKMIDFLRASTNSTQTLPLEEIEDMIGTDPTQVEAGMIVRKIVAALPERMRRPIELMKLQGLSVSETAAITGTSEAAVKVNVHRGMKAMARALG